MLKKTDVGAVVVGIAWFVFVIWHRGGVLWETGPGNVPSQPSYVVQADTLLGVKPVATLAAGKPELAHQLGKDFRVFARVYALQEGKVLTKDLHEQITRFVVIRIQDGGYAPNSLPGFDAALTQARDKVLGSKEGSIETAQAVDFLHALAQALGG